MKKLIFLFPFIIYSCTKKESISSSAQLSPTSVDSTESLPEVLQDSAQRGIILLQDSVNFATQPFRVVEGNEIIRTINGEMLPVILTEKFTSKETQLLLKIKNFKGKNISVLISPENPDMNIRVNQIKLPNGAESGPFGRTLEMPISQEGEFWLEIGKSNMVSGNPTGKFRVDIK